MAMSVTKVLSLILGGVVLLIAGSMLAVWLLVNPNDFKPRIVAAVKSATGRELVLSGDIKLSVFPWIAFDLGPASLGNPPGFGAQPFLSFNHASVRVRLLPLLAKRLDVGRVEIDDLDLKLQRDAQGRGNWEGFGKQGPAAQQGPAAAPAAAPGSAETLRAIEGIKVSHARASYQDLTLENLEFETGSFTGSGVVPVTAHVDAKRSDGTSASLDARLDFGVEASRTHFTVSALNLDGTVNLAGNPRPIQWRLAAPRIEVDTERQTLSLPKYSLTAAGAELSGALEGSRILDAPQVSGSLALAPLIVREFLPRLGLTAPATRDPKALQSASASGEFNYGANQARVAHLSATLDDTHLTGSADWQLESHALSFALALDRIDLDRYLPPAEAATAHPSEAAPAPAGPTAAAAPPLAIEGTLSVDAVHAAPLDLTAVKATLSDKGGMIRVHPLTAQIDGGQYSGDVNLDERAASPVLSLDEHLTGIDVGKLLEGSSKTLRLSGHGNLNLKATGRGAGADAILKSLNGHFDANVAGGALEGLDLGYEISEAEALLKRQASASVQNTHRTAFDVFKMSAEIAGGVATTKDLTISSTVLKVTGQGSANLGTQGLDMALLVDTLKSISGTPVQIPVKVTGNLTDPMVRPDVEVLAKGELKQKAEDLLKDRLKGLFGKP
jgi:AsmA protein